MRIFLDANILVTVVRNEYPRYGPCARVMSLADRSGFQVYTSPLCLAITFYFAEKKNGRKLAKKKMTLLVEKLKITKMDGSTVENAVKDKKVEDFEDGLQYYSALASKCEHIVTYDKGDFYFSRLEVLDAEEFLLKYVAKQN